MAYWQRHLINSDGIEVQSINSYAVLMGYLSMAIKGLGFLVLTWTTVVLLGGFVSILHKKDFWCLTFITLVQTAGIFDVNMNEKLGYMKNAYMGLLKAIILGVVGGPIATINHMSDGASICLSLMLFLLMLVQVAVFAIILGPLAIIYVFGIFMSGAISLWRLIEHDYGDNSDGEASNLAPAMDTLYYLALLQGVLLCYRFVLGRVGKRLSKYAFTKDSEVQQVLHDYLRETKKGCGKNPAFVEGRNLITYALDKIGSNSPHDCSSGVNILYAAICMVESHYDATDQHLLMKHIILSSSSSQYVVQKLLEILDSRGIYDRKRRSIVILDSTSIYYDRNMRNQAAAIVERLALYINLEQFPRGIQHISSLIGTFEHYTIAKPYLSYKDEEEQDLKQQWRPSPAGELAEVYKKLLLQGMSILQNLAVNEKNCRVMSDTRDLVSKIMVPITSDLLDHTTDDHGTWYEVVNRSMEVMSQLTGAQGETGAKIRREISSCAEAIDTLWRILSCKNCKGELQQRAIWILTRLYMDTIGISRSADFHVLKKENNCCREDFVRMLVNIFTHRNEYRSSVRRYAGEALSEICFLAGISDVTIVMQTSGDAVDSLARVFFYEIDLKCKQAAVEILEHLYTQYTKDDEYRGKLKKAILKVTGEILCCRDKTHSGEDEFVKPENDIESQFDDSQENNEQDKEDDGVQVDSPKLKLLSSLLSLCGTLYDTAVIIDLPPHLDVSIFLKKLNKIVLERSDPVVENLSLCKATGKMVISMMKYYSSARFFKQEEFGSLIEALSSTSKKMLDLDYVVCNFDSSSGRSKLSRRTLASLVREAKELQAMAPSASFSG